MHSRQRSLQSASPPARGAEAFAPSVATLVVTTDDAVWGALASMAGVVDPRQYDSISELTSQWPARCAAVVVVDARAAADLQAQLTQILAHGGALVPVAIVDEDLRGAAASLERQRVLFDHLLMPLDAGTAQTVVARAGEEAAARLALTAGDTGLPSAASALDPDSARATLAKDASRPAPAAAVASTPPANSARIVPGRRWLLLAAVALALLAGTAWWWQGDAPRNSAPPAASAVASAPGTAVVGAGAMLPHAQSSQAMTDEQVELSLERARLAMRERRYIDPVDDNALGHYKAVLALEAANGEARQGLQRITELLLARAATALAARDNPAALRSLEAARALQPGHPRLAALDAQVGSRAAELSAAQVQAAMQANAFVRAATLLGQAEKSGAVSAVDAAQLRQEIARRSAAAQLAELARLTQARIAQGQLLEPAGDNARQYLATLQERAGTAMADEIARLGELYQKRLVGEAHAAMTAGAWTQAETWLAELRATRGASAAAVTLQKDLDKARAAVRAAEPGRTTAPPVIDAPTATPASQTPTPVAAAPAIVAPAHLSKSLQVAYPRQAALHNTTGWVQVELDVDAAGRVENAHVLDASPRGVFDEAALAAVRRAAFVAAVASDGSRQRMTVALKVHFQLDDRP